MTDQMTKKNQKGIPLISFIVVTHNRDIELILNRIIRSINNQTHPRIELILIGEACPYINQLAEITKSKYSFERLEWMYLPRLEEDDDEMCMSALQARARNKGIMLAKGEYISCQDDDNELENNFASTLLECINKNNAEAAYCYRRIVMPDGTPFKGDFFPWIEHDDSRRRRIVYKIWKKAGIITSGSDIVKDNLFARKNTDIISTVDANEWLVKSEILKLFPYREKYTCANIEKSFYIDDLWNLDIKNSSIKVACSERASLIYYLGGVSNTIPKNY